MKTILIMIALLVVVAGSSSAQCYSPYTPDVWMWGYSGDQVRGGILPYDSADQVGGIAFASNGNPNLPFAPIDNNVGLDPCTFITYDGFEFGDALVLENVTQVCNGINYNMKSYQVSARPRDGLPDHIYQSGLAYGSNPGDANTPAVQEQVEAASLVSDSGKLGYAYTAIMRRGYCKSNAPI